MQLVCTEVLVKWYFDHSRGKKCGGKPSMLLLLDAINDHCTVNAKFSKQIRCGTH